MAALLYFFENNTGSRVILLVSFFVWLLPNFRHSFRKAKQQDEPRQAPATIRAWMQTEEDEPGDIRPYTPGDSLRWIHWKLSAKKDELLVQERSREHASVEAVVPQEQHAKKRRLPSRRKFFLTILLLLSVLTLLLLLLPEANRGLQALCNRLFTASEAVNAYQYTRFDVPADQSIFVAIILLACICGLMTVACFYSRSRLPALGMMTALSLLQVYFGLSLPPWSNMLLYGLIGAKCVRMRLTRQTAVRFGSLLAVILVFVLLVSPGVHTATEATSETVRDLFSSASETIFGGIQEQPEGETAVRHVFTQSLVSGNNEARIDRSFQLLTVEEEQISLPHWVNYLRIILLLLLTGLLLILPFLPFFFLNLRKKKVLAAREIFHAENINEAVCAIFQETIHCFEITDHGAGNLLYRFWPDHLPSFMPEGYAARFAVCAGYFEKAAYGSTTLTENEREVMLSLLQETRQALYQAADWKQRLYLKYWMYIFEE